MSNHTINEYEPDSVSPPGETLLETIEALGMSQAELAERTGRPRKTINEIIKGKAGITPETALQFEKVLGVPASYWNNHERIYREYLARKGESEQLSPRVDWLKEFPVRAMVKFGWINESQDKVQMLRELLAFFGIASPDQWQTVWDRPHVAYRKSSTFQADPGAISVWLRKGEIEAQKIECAPFDATMFQTALVQVRAMTRLTRDVFEPEVRRICAEAGVAWVLVPEMPASRVCGATRWLGPSKALMQLSLRYKSDDHFWFTFFHEAGHILLHGRKDVFVEADSVDDPREQEANDFAANFLIPPSRFNEFIASAGSLSKEGIKAFAEEIGIAPGIVVGRLQKEERIPFKNCNELKQKLEWRD